MNREKPLAPLNYANHYLYGCRGLTQRAQKFNGDATVKFSHGHTVTTVDKSEYWRNFVAWTSVGKKQKDDCKKPASLGAATNAHCQFLHKAVMSMTSRKQAEAIHCWSDVNLFWRHLLAGFLSRHQPCQRIDFVTNTVFTTVPRCQISAFHYRWDWRRAVSMFLIWSGLKMHPD